MSVRNLNTYLRGESGIIKVVNDVSFDLDRGQVLGIVGESGAGKTMLCRTLLGLSEAGLSSTNGNDHESQLVFDGVDLLKASPAQRQSIRGKRMAMIFQDPMSSLNPYLSVEAQLTEVLVHHEKTTSDVARKRAIELLDRVGIEEPHRRIKQYPHEFSGGMRQRVMLAMALMCTPALLIADEPTTALDTTTQVKIVELIQSLRAEYELALIWVTHDLALLSQIADHILVMYAGRFVEEGPASEVFARPRHPYTRGLIASIPSAFGPRVQTLVSIGGQAPPMSALPAGCHFHPRCGEAQPVCSVQDPPIRRHSQNHWSSCVLDEADP